MKHLNTTQYIEADDEGEIDLCRMHLSAKARQNLFRNETLPRLLLIDDDLIFCKILERTAQTRGLSLSFETNPAKLHHKDLSLYEIVLCDFELPKVTGAQLSRVIHQMEPNKLFILVTSWLNPCPELRKQGLKVISKKAGPHAILTQSIMRYHLKPGASPPG